MSNRKQTQKGSAILEFTLVGIPLIFLLISTVEMARGMWLYHTLAYAVRGATRFTIVKGQNCATSPNACSTTVGMVARELRRVGIGLDPNQLKNVTLRAVAGRTITCATLARCLDDNTPWPTAGPGNAPDAGGQPGNDIEIAAIYPFQSAMVLFWPGAGKAVRIATFNMAASSKEKIQF